MFNFHLLDFSRVNLFELEESIWNIKTFWEQSLSHAIATL